MRPVVTIWRVHLCCKGHLSYLLDVMGSALQLWLGSTLLLSFIFDGRHVLLKVGFSLHKIVPAVLWANCYILETLHVSILSCDSR